VTTRKDTSSHILLELKNGEHYNCDVLANKAKQHGVKVYTTLPYWHQKESWANNVVLLGFSNLRETEIEKGVGMLRSAWF
jgi:GntR family transcriptional regulator/MocR family aminotransferase